MKAVWSVSKTAYVIEFTKEELATLRLSLELSKREAISTRNRKNMEELQGQFINLDMVDIVQ